MAQMRRILVRRWEDGHAVRIVSRRASTVVALCLFLLLSIPAVAGAVGELSFDECFGQATGCISISGNPLQSAQSVAVSPNSGAVYVGSELFVSHFSADPATGALDFGECLTNPSGTSACTRVVSGTTPFESVRGIAVDPTRPAVFTTSADRALVTQLFDSAGGQVTYGGCVGDEGGGACGLTNAGRPMQGASSVAVSPSGESLYVAAVGFFGEKGGISHFGVAPGGQIDFRGCISSDGSGGNCGKPSAPEHSELLENTQDVAVSPDGKAVYAASVGGGIVTRFSANAEGQITWLECASDDGSSGNCTKVPGTPLVEPDGIVVSPDGASVYVASFKGTVSHFIVEPNGQLAWEGCFSSDGSRGCADLPGAGTPLENAEDLAISADGKSLYAIGESAITSFAVGAQGRLTFQQCLSSKAMAGCDDMPGDPLRSGEDIAVSPNGRSVYAVGANSDTLIHLSRAVPAAPSAGETPITITTLIAPLVPGGGAVTSTQTPAPTSAELKASLLAQLTPSGKAAKLASVKKNKGYSFAFKSLTAGAVTIGWYFLPPGGHVARKGKSTPKPKPVLFATGQASFTAAATKAITIKLTGKALALLKHKSSLKLTAKGSIKQPGAAAITAIKTFTLKS